LLFQCTPKAADFVEASEESKKFLNERKAGFGRGELLLALSMLEHLQGEMRRNLAAPRLLVETALLKLLHLEGLKSVENLISKSESAEGSLRNMTVHMPLRASPKISSQPPPVVLKDKQVSQASAGSGTITLNDVEDAWPRIVEYVKSKRMSNGIFLSESSPLEVADGNVTLGFPMEFQFHKETLEKDNNRKLVEEAFEVVLGKKLRTLFAITHAEQEEHEAGPPPSAPGQDSKLPEIIEQAINIFENAKVIRKDP
jgi:DNA polymerase-3 subunit gamma/tau